MATAPVARSAMTKEEFRASKEFLALTDKQRRWVDVFVDSQDAALATRIAYGDHTDSPYRAMLTRKVESSPRVIAALDLYFARSPREKFLRDLENDIKHSTGVARIEARRLYAKIMGLVDGSPMAAGEASSGQYCIGQLVTQRDNEGVLHTGTVAELDANGRPTRIETIS